MGARGLALLLLVVGAAGAETPLADGHPCADPALASKPFCDGSLTTGQRAAALRQALDEMGAAQPPLPLDPLGGPPGAAAREAAAHRARPPLAAADPGLERLEVGLGFVLGCVSACCAVLLTAMRAACRKSLLLLKDPLAAAAAAPTGQQQQPQRRAGSSDDGGDAATAVLMAELDELIGGSASGGGSGGGSAARGKASTRVRGKHSGDGREAESVRSLLDSLEKSEQRATND